MSNRKIFDGRRFGLNTNEDRENEAAMGAMTGVGRSNAQNTGY